MTSYRPPSVIGEIPPRVAAPGPQEVDSDEEEEQQPIRTIKCLYFPERAAAQEEEVAIDYLRQYHYTELTMGSYNVRFYYLQSQSETENHLASTLTNTRLRGPILLVDVSQPLTLRDLDQLFHYRIF